MTEIKNLLSDRSHRPFALPAGPWKYYQEWDKVLFFHWKVPFDSLRNCVPEKFNIDRFDGDCYVSLVAFTIRKMKPRIFPAIKFISDFHEINLRTYIDNNHKKGIYFLSIEAQKYLSAFIARSVSGLPYQKSEIKRTDKSYQSINKTENFHLNTEFEVGQKLPHKTELDIWLTERYCLYLERNKKAYRYDVHHREWELKNVYIKNLQLNYEIDNLALLGSLPDRVHYSDGVEVLVWQ